MTVWLLTWLWQGLALTLGVAAVLKLGLRILNAATRHAIWWCALAGVIWLGWTSSPYGGLTPALVHGSNPVGTSLAPEPLFLAPSVAPVFLSIFLGVWAAIALVQLVRLVPSLHALYALRDRCQPIPAHIESQLPLWRESRSRGRRAELVICDALPCATLLGFDRPCIALPSTLVAALDVEELDQIVLHEHAHVQRRDDWTRLAQRLIEAVLCIHPAVVLIARALNREREMACDEWVVARTNAPRVYARCLAHAAEVRGRIAAPALGPALFGGQHDLIRRVDRLLAVKGAMRRRVSAFAIAAAACVIGIMSVQLNAFPLVGDYVETWLPEVGAPVARLTAAVLPTAISQVAETPAPFRVRLNAQPQNTAQSTSPSAYRPAPGQVSTSTESQEPREGFDSREPSVLSARPIEAAYQPRTNPVSADSPSPWRAAALPGVSIARAARKTGVGIAGAFTRAGVGLAKSF